MKKNILIYGRRIFNFHPEEPFDSIGDLLEVAWKANHHPYYYQAGAADLAEYMARVIDMEET